MPLPHDIVHMGLSELQGLYEILYASRFLLLAKE